MSRIQEILKKAERDGSVHRTRAVVADGPIVADRPVHNERPALSERPAHSATATALADPPSVLIPPSPAAASRGGVAAAIDPRLVAAIAPQSLAAEQYRSLRTRVARAENGRPVRTIIITSPNKGDGKSLTAANLALTMAQEYNQRVLLLDADLRRPSLHRLFGISDTPGLTDVLMGGATIDDALVTVPEHRLTILPAGIVPTQPTELLGSASMQRVIDQLRTRFDRILIDMPPAAPLADVTVASALADGVLMIVRAGVTPKPAIERALAGLDNSKVLGLVLNDAGESSVAYAYAGYKYAAG
jgi:capsular exopolysaccharide synthesis family protein